MDAATLWSAAANCGEPLQDLMYQSLDCLGGVRNLVWYLSGATKTLTKDS